MPSTEYVFVTSVGAICSDPSVVFSFWINVDKVVIHCQKRILEAPGYDSINIATILYLSVYMF